MALFIVISNDINHGFNEIKVIQKAKAFSKLAQVTEFQSFIHCSTVSYGERERVHGIPCSFSRCSYYCIKTVIEITP